MPKETQTRSSRQRPISCRFCRSRKLRCNREAPCSNCTSRGISCELETLSRPPSDTDSPTKTELLDRIRKLEELVEKVHRDSRQTSAGEQSSESASHCTQQTPNSDVSPHVQHLDRDVAYLESVCDAGGSERSLLHDKFRFQICSVQHMLEMQQPRNSYSFSTANSGLVKHVWLPEYSEAKVLLEKFVRHIAHFHHVYHMPSLPNVLDRVYSCLNQRIHVKSGEIILLLSIFGSSSHSWSQDDCRERGLFSSPVEAHRQSEVWVTATEDLIGIANRTTPVSIEGIQGIIIMLFVANAVDGISRRCRSFTNMALSFARELGLHCIDHPSNAHLANTVQAEVGRRVWWWLVSCDWSVAMAARFNDVPMGIYQCHLRHMMTNKPLNLDDEYVVDGMSCAGMPASQPTALSYTLQRVRMAEISRNMADRTSPLTAHTSTRSYHIIMDIDTELQLLLNDTPPFFSMAVKDISRIYLVDEHRAMCIAQQGHKFHSLLYALRCKLHLPYLSRAFTNTEYASSRDICIQSAQLIIQTEADIEMAGLCKATRYSPIGLIMSVFMACIVLLMDLCHSQDSQHRERQRSEIARAIQMLEDARHESYLVAKFLDSMMQVLRKHKIAPPKLVGQPTQTPTLHEKDSAIASTHSDSINGFPSVPTPMSISIPPSGAQASNGTSGVGVTGDRFATEEDIPYLCELTRTLNEGLDVSDFNWDDIFLDLDASFLLRSELSDRR
ncbi:hypothetical protein K469DRAFT_812559 [Zopfia rhizophila CBS 207.26]|uniref:Zn(2)-C6 fungal-type domain-containing protein n=1 Tax=Zopfia rhizophila CBS 207.26 TaxID=1314779 RepID=A0A6A6DFG7_9PEZI|nr:hypothetical protein K469DRAFT_812559 [Zopfia rhizophila CBS 207.26]